MDTGWPWPVDGVQQWFEGLWNWIGEAANNAVGVVKGWIDSANLWIRDRVKEIVDNVKGWINDSVGWLKDRVQDIVNAVKGWVDGAAGWIRDRVKEIVDTVKGWVDGAATWIRDSIKGVIDAVASGINATLSWISTTLGDLANKIIAAIPPQIKDAIDFIISLAGKVGEAMVAFFKDPIGSIQAGLNQVANSVIEMVNRGISGLSAFLGETLAKIVGALGEGLQFVIDWLLKHLTWFAEMVVGAINAVVATVKDTIGALFTTVINEVTKAFGPKSPDPELKQAVDVMVGTMWSRQVDIISDMYKSPPEAEDVFFSSALILALLTAGSATGFITTAAMDFVHPIKEIMAHRTFREMLWMVGVPAVTASIITLPTAIGLLTPLRYALNEQWQPMQPGASDIVRFAVRECFIPERLETLLEFYPGEEYKKAMAREGYSEKWARYFWGAHWVLPPLDWLNRYMWRHDEFKNMWRKYIRYEDYIPESIPWLEEVIYEPWTRVDIRRMWDMRTISEADMYREYRWGGYDDAHAKGLVLWTKVYTALPDLRARLRNGWITEGDMRDELVKIGMPSDRVNELMETIIPRDKGDRTSGERDLTKADILSLFKIGQITDLQAMDMLERLGYDEEEARYLIAIASDKMDTELKDLTSSQILKAYRFEVFDRPTAKDRLIAAGWTDTAAETLLRLEDVKLADSKVDRMRERDLTPSQIFRAIKAAVIDRDTGIAYLAYLGYSEWEIMVLVSLEGV